MNDSVAAPQNSTASCLEYRNQSVWLPQVFLDEARQDRYVLNGLIFEDCLIEGPAIIVPIAGCHFDDCFLGEHGGDPRILMLTPMAPDQVVGAIPLVDCTFRRCRFSGVGFTGSADFLQRLQDLFSDTAQ